jgi:hypothetical protein
MLPTNSNDPFCAVCEVKSNRECSISRYSFEKKNAKDLCTSKKCTIFARFFGAMGFP